MVTMQKDRQAKAAPDLVKRQCAATAINQLWVGLLYLAVADTKQA
jgi:hypothetical protein